MTDLAGLLTPSASSGSCSWREYFAGFGLWHELLVTLPPQGGFERRLMRHARWAMSVQREGSLAAHVAAAAPGGFRDRIEAVRRTVPVLTPRQVELMRRVAQGQTNRQVAHDLGLSEGTVRKHLENIYARLGVDSRTEAVARMPRHCSAEPCLRARSRGDRRTARLDAAGWGDGGRSPVLRRLPQLGRGRPPAASGPRRRGRVGRNDHAPEDRDVGQGSQRRIRRLADHPDRRAGPFREGRCRRRACLPRLPDSGRVERLTDARAAGRSLRWCQGTISGPAPRAACATTRSIRSYGTGSPSGNLSVPLPLA